MDAEKLTCLNTFDSRVYRARLLMRFALLKRIMIVALAALIGACGPSKVDVQVVASEKALKSLHKLQAATQVGVTLPMYRQQLIEAQADVNDAVALFPPDSFFAWRLRAAMGCYVDAAHFWDLQGTGRRFYDDPGDDDGRALVRGYAATAEGISPRGHLVGDPAKGVQNAWEHANIFIASTEQELAHRDFSAKQSPTKGNQCRNVQ